MPTRLKSRLRGRAWLQEIKYPPRKRQKKNQSPGSVSRSFVESFPQPRFQVLPETGAFLCQADRSCVPQRQLRLEYEGTCRSHPDPGSNISESNAHCVDLIE